VEWCETTAHYDRVAHEEKVRSSLSQCTSPGLIEQGFCLLIQNRIVRIGNGFQKAHFHESGAIGLLDIGDLLRRQAELIHKRKVRVGSSHQRIVVEHNQLFIGDLKNVERRERYEI
jgi:hypothetical protein